MIVMLMISLSITLSLTIKTTHATHQNLYLIICNMKWNIPRYQYITNSTYYSNSSLNLFIDL